MKLEVDDAVTTLMTKALAGAARDNVSLVIARAGEQA